MICQSNGTWLGGDVPKCCKFFFILLNQFRNLQIRKPTVNLTAIIFYLDPPVEHLVLSEIAIIVACLVLILILFMAAVFLYNTR